MVTVDGTSYTGFSSGSEQTVVTLAAGTYTLYYEDTWGDGCNPSTGSYGSCWVQVSYENLVGQVVPSTSGYGTDLDNDDDGDGAADDDDDAGWTQRNKCTARPNAKSTSGSSEEE